MDKVTRILFLYRALMKGALIYKSSACVNFGISPRSFDRDIQDIRLFLSESFSNLELVFDEERQGYGIKNVDTRREIGTGEAYILTKLLLDSRQMRTDDQEEIVKIMLSQLSSTEKRRVIPVLSHSPKPSPCLNKASVKLVEDLLLSIERKDRISLQFETQYQERICVPYSVEFRNRDAFLAAWDLEENQPLLYVLDEIRSYVPANYPYELSEAQKEMLQALVITVDQAELNACQPFIYEKELVT